MRKILPALLAALLITTNAHSRTMLFTQQVSEGLKVTFTRDDSRPETLSWQASLVNIRDGKSVTLDSYTLGRVPMQLGDRDRMAYGEDLALHHNLAGAILIGQQLYVVHNMGGTIILHHYSSPDGATFTHDRYAMYKYPAVGAQGKGYQHAGFLVLGDALFILATAGSEMASRYGQQDHLFRYDMRIKKLFAISFRSQQEGDESLAATLEVSVNPFETGDLNAPESAGGMKKAVLEVLPRLNKAVQPGTPARVLGALENADAWNAYKHTDEHQRTTGEIYFFYDAGGLRIIRFQPRVSGGHLWLAEAFTEVEIEGRR